MKIHPDFADFISALKDTDVDFVIVGAYALAFHGQPRSTGDIDFWIRPTHENAKKLIEAISSFGFGQVGITIDDILSGKIIQLGFPPVRIDIMTRLDGLDEDEIWKSKVQDSFGEHKVWYIGQSAYVKNKKSSGRHKDLADLELLGVKVENSSL